MRMTVLLGVALAASGCYHATIETGLAPSPETVEVPWAASWIVGLVPPKTVETAQQCPNGVAVVETKQSFLNGLVGVLTAGIFTPMHITVTCAAGSRMDAADSASIEINSDASMIEKREAMTKAAQLSARMGSAVLVAF